MAELCRWPPSRAVWGTRRPLAALAAALVANSAASYQLDGTSPDATRRPKHLLLVVIDDLGFDDMGFRNNGQISTPHFNELAREGVIMGNYYVQPSCSPTRATIMTGRKPAHTGVNFWIPNEAYGLPLRETTLAQVMNSRGFVSHGVGKWHLGFFKTPYTPTFRGFHSFYGLYEGGGDYFKHTCQGVADLHLEDQPLCGPACTKVPWGATGTYSTNLYAERAVQLISAHNTEHPLFMYLAFQGVHWPRQSPQGYVEPYRHSIADEGRRTFAGMLSALDEGMGNVTAALRAKGMLNDTLILVTTDNGGPTTDCIGPGALNWPSSNWPFRGSKCSVWEGGTRGTSFLSWPGFPEAVKGTTWPGLAHAADWLPTLASAVGTSVQPTETLPLDGLDLWDTLLRGGDSPREEVYYGISQDLRGPAARDREGYKLIRGDGGGAGHWSPRQGPTGAANVSTPTTEIASAPWLLYNVRQDEGERHPLPLDKYPEVVKRLRAVIDRWEASTVPQLRGDPSCPRFGPHDSAHGPWLGPWCDPPGAEGENVTAPV